MENRVGKFIDETKIKYDMYDVIISLSIHLKYLLINITIVCEF